MEMKICHLYPDVLNLYGDTGNVACLTYRLQQRGIEASVTRLPIGETSSLAEFDLLFIGGGQDFEQEVLLADLHQGKDKSLRAAIEDGVTMLAICGGYQMLGAYYQNAAGRKCEYLGALDFYTVAGEPRLIGNYAFQLGEASGGSSVVGFENHGGRTYLGPGVEPLGHILKGNGNNGQDHTEGVRYKNVFGTYCHGPALPKNPAFADEILRTALDRKYGVGVGVNALAPLDDTTELAAHTAALKKLHLRG